MKIVNRLFYTLTLSSFTFLFSEPTIPSINDIMSIEDQTTTGVIRLTQEQKMALAKWIVDHGCYKKEQVEDTIHALKVSLNVEGGRLIQLSDNSVYEIAPKDREITSTWISAIPIKVESSKDASYPFYLKNLNNGVKVLAKRSSI